MPDDSLLKHVLMQSARKEVVFIAVAVGLTLVQGLAALLTPLFAGLFAADVLKLDGGFRFGLGGLVLLWMLVLAVQALTRFGSSYLLTLGGARVLARLSRRLHDHLLALPMPFFESRKRGDLLSLHSNDVATIAHFVTGGVAGVLPALVVLVGAIVMMARIDVQIALLVATMAPLFFITIKLLGRRLRPLSERVVNEQASTLALAGEQLAVIPLIKGFVKSTEEGRRFGAGLQRVLAVRKDQLRLQAALAPALQFIASLCILLVLWFSSAQLDQGRVDLAQFVSLLLYGLLLTRPVSGLANIYGEALQARAAAMRLEQIFAQAPEPSSPGATQLPPVAGEISIEGIDFAYPKGPAVLAQLDLQVAAGEVLAITGGNGAGKSSLLHLLMRFIEPSRGTIRIDGHDIRDCSLDSLRRQIALVTQRVLLIDGTVRENIAYGAADATSQQVEEAARLAQAHDFIMGLPQAYASPVGEDGVRLSGGERQRIALARALVAKPKILLLDEATAMLDEDTESMWVTGGLDAFAGRTVILVTHRPASLALAHRVLRLDEGVLRAQPDQALTTRSMDQDLRERTL